MKKQDRADQYAMGHRTVAVVPARSGSKGLPDKNVKPFHGVPLLAWSIRQGSWSPEIDRVVVSTDSESYAETAREYGGDVPFVRPDEHSTDDAPTSDVIIHALDWLRDHGETFDVVVLLEPTSPLRRRPDLDDAISRLKRKLDDATAMVSVVESGVQSHPYKAKLLDEHDRMRPFLDSPDEYRRRQQLPTVYHPDGTIYASSVPAYRTQETFYQDRTLGHPVEKWQHIEIDDIHDFVCAERLAEHEAGDIACFS